MPCNLNYKVFFFFFHFQIVKLNRASEITGPNCPRSPLEFHNASIFPAPSQLRATVRPNGWFYHGALGE